MADKKLESITFPDLPDRYVVKPDIADVTGLQTALDGKADTEDVYNAFVTENLTGSIASFDDGADDIPVKGLVADIVPLQSGSGDPSPSNVRAISGWTECNVNVAKKNLFAGTVYKSGYGILADGTESSVPTFDIYTDYFPMGTYTFSVLASGISPTVRIHGFIGGVWQKQIAYKQISYGAYGTITFDIEDHFDEIRISAPKTQYAENFQVELGSTATTYEPYNGSTHTINWQSQAGTVYGGSIDVTTGVLTVDRAAADLSTLGFSYNSTWQCWTVGSIANSKAPTDNNTPIGAISDRLTAVKASGYTTSHESGTVATNTGGIWFVDNGSTTELTGQLVYELATPQTYQLTPTEVKTLLGNNNVWADTGDIDLTYRADLGLYLDKIINA